MHLGCFESVFLTIFFGYCAIIAVSQAGAFLGATLVSKQATKQTVKEG